MIKKIFPISIVLVLAMALMFVLTQKKHDQ
jgi:hypothetical protein